uniref:Uncharacterized protein n=1 Tax=Cacopsylla melanoneura TaxID=428564 RepID=A0A8D8RJB1_9HEMI
MEKVRYHYLLTYCIVQHRIDAVLIGSEHESAQQWTSYRMSQGDGSYPGHSDSRCFPYQATLGVDQHSKVLPSYKHHTARSTKLWLSNSMLSLRHLSILSPDEYKHHTCRIDKPPGPTHSRCHIWCTISCSSWNIFGVITAVGKLSLKDYKTVQIIVRKTFIL